MFVYVRSEANLWTVGHYTPSGGWIAESDHGTAAEAAERVHWLNGGNQDKTPAKYPFGFKVVKDFEA